MAYLAVKNLTVTYPEGTAPVLRDVSFSLASGEFAVLCGATGCGKSTLLRMLKRELAPKCVHSGCIFYKDTPISSLDARVAVTEIGFVAQQPDQQIVTDRVWHELAFGLENLGTPPDLMRRSVAEIASYFGLEQLLERDPATLSGGQKQLLNLASAVILGPRLLLLDEPTAQLDPVASSEFFATLARLNRDFSMTILLTEHCLEEVIPLADRLLILDSGRLIADNSPRSVLAALPDDSPVLLGMPAAVRIHRKTKASGEISLSVGEARRKLMPQFSNAVRSLPDTTRTLGAYALEVHGACFRYERRSSDILFGLDLRVPKNELYCLIGGNGAGKSTVLGILSGILRIYAGKVRIFGKIITEYRGRSLHSECVALLPQDVQTVFLCNTGAEELAELDKQFSSTLRDFPFDLTPLLSRHPYDLSGGEQQILALAKVMLTKPRLLLLDEPTKALDAHAKVRFAEVLRGLCANGVTVLMVTHDLEFAACHADLCGFLSQGRLVSEGTPREMFSQNAFYTTAASRITRGFYDGAVTVEDAAMLCLMNGKRGEGAACG